MMTISFKKRKVKFDFFEHISEPEDLRYLNIYKVSVLGVFSGADLGGGCRGCALPPTPPEMTCGFLKQLVFCKKNNNNYVVY